MRLWLAVFAVLGSGCVDGVATVGPLEDMCDQIFDCYDFLDSLECQDEWFAVNDPARACDNESSYLNCMDPCLTLGCNTALDNCELKCWSAHCGKVAR